MNRRMNPLSLVTERFLVAEGADGEVVGFGQLAPLGGGGSDGPQRLELRSLVVQPDHRSLRSLVAHPNHRICCLSKRELKGLAHECATQGAHTLCLSRSATCWLQLGMNAERGVQEAACLKPVPLACGTCLVPAWLYVTITHVLATFRLETERGV